MSKRVFIPGLSALCAFAMIGSVAATALAQQVPVQVVQGSDGTLYVEQGSNSWTLVPNQISDSDAAALNPSGEIDGTLPNSLFVVQAPASPPAAAPAPAPPAAPAAPVVVDKLVRNYNVIYAAQSVVSIAGGDGGYTVTAKGPLHWKVPVGMGTNLDAGTCDLPDGTIIATFALSGTQYIGHHGIWDKSCQFVLWGSLVLNLNGSLLSGNYIGGGPVSFSPA